MSNADIALLERWLKQGDPEAFKTVALRYAGMVYGTCRRILRNHSDAEEVAQDCFAALASGQVKPAVSMGPWLHRVATNRALKRLSSDRHRRSREKAYAEQVSRTGHDTGWNDIYDLVDEAIDRLPERFRTPIVAHFLDNETHDAIAQRLGVSRQTVTYRISKGVELVRAALKRKGVEIAAAALAALLASNTSEAAPAELVAGVGKLALAGPKYATPAGLMTAAKLAIGAASVVVLIGVVGVFGSWRLRQAARDRLLNTNASQPAATTFSRMLSLAGAALSSSAPQEGKSSPAPPNPGAKNVKDSADEGAITGRVYDAETREGISGAKIRVYSYPESKMLAGDWQSGNDGRYRIEHLGPGKYGVSIFRYGVPKYPLLSALTQIEATIKAGHGAQGVDFALTQGIPVTGRVVRADGMPARGATVLGSVQCGNHRSWSLASGGKAAVVSDSDGVFTAYFPLIGQWLRLQATLDDAARSEPYGPVSLPRNGRQNVTLTLSDKYSASVEGRLVNPKGAPLKEYAISLRTPPAGLEADTLYVADAPNATTDDKGAFRIMGVAAGSYDVTAFSWHNPKIIRPVVQPEKVAAITLTEGEAITGLELSLDTTDTGLAIAGHTVDPHGKPIASMRICASSSVMNSSLCAVSDDDGAFRIDSLPEGAYFLLVNEQRYNQVKATVRNVPAGTENLVITTAGFGQVEGQLVSARDGAAISRFELYVTEGGSKEFDPRLLKNRRDVFDSEGKFSVDGLNPGVVTIAAKAEGFSPAFREVTIVDGKTVKGVEIRMTPSQYLKGKVVAVTGTPIADSRIVLGNLPAEPDLDANVATRTNVDGTFTLVDTPPNLTRISAYCPGFAPATVEVSHASRIVLAAESALKGRVTVAGAPQVRALARIESPNGPNVVATDGDGIFRFAGLAAGNVTVSVEVDDGRQFSRDATLAPGKTTTVDFDFGSDSGVIEGRLALNRVPPDQAHLDLSIDTEEGRASLRPNVEADGSYRVEHAPPGHARLVAVLRDADGGETRRFAAFDVTDGATARQDLDFAGGSTIQGTVSGAGADVAAVICVLPADVAVPSVLGEHLVDVLKTQSVALGRCGPNGSFRLEHVPAGEYTVIVCAVPESSKDDPSRWRTAVAPVGVASETVTVDLRPR